jgi:hypothetical protein
MQVGMKLQPMVLESYSYRDYKKLAVHWIKESMCFVYKIQLLADSLVLGHRQLL